jgi:hypothetical protein
MMDATATTAAVTIESRIDGVVRSRTTDLNELREIAAEYPGGTGCFTVQTPFGPVWWAERRVYHDNSKWAGSGASQTWWIEGDLSDLIAIAERMLTGTPFEAIYEGYEDS